MLAYLLRKLVLTASIVLGVMLLTFMLFNVVAKDPARSFSGKHVSKELLEARRHEMGLDKPKIVLNFEAYHKATNDQQGHWERIKALLDTQFIDILTFQFPKSMTYQESVWKLFGKKAPVSLMIQGPAFFIGLGLQLVIAMLIAARRNTWLDYSATAIAVFMMSIPALSIYITVQWLLAAKLGWFPISGWSTGFVFSLQFAALPILVSVVGGLGSSVRFYRTVALEEINKDYTRTARSKGVGENNILLVHVFRNLLIPVVTQTVVAIPFLVTGSLLLEQMFEIPGFAKLLVEAIHAADSPVVMAEIYLSSIVYAIMLFLTDICYALVDPRVTLK